MKKAVIYIRSATGDQGSCDRQRDELLAKFGHTHEIVGEFRDVGSSGNTGVEDRHGLKNLLDHSGRGEFAVVLCSDVTRLSRRPTPEVAQALLDNGVQIVTLRDGEIGTEPALKAILGQAAKTYQEYLSDRTKRGIRAAKERRASAKSDEADA